MLMFVTRFFFACGDYCETYSSASTKVNYHETFK